jgi:hypothetical protein
MLLWSVTGPGVIRSRLHATRVGRTSGFANNQDYAVKFNWLLMKLETR